MAQEPWQIAVCYQNISVKDAYAIGKFLMYYFLIE